MSKAIASILRHKHPTKASQADHGNSRSAAIELHCTECMGGSRLSAKGCDLFVCFLWPYRPGKDHSRPHGAVPTAEEYKAAADASLSPAQQRARAEAGERLRQARKRNNEQSK
jgi:hypothetical protein